MWIPCCLVWDGVKLELELELELAGLGCSDLKEEKVIINKCTGHSCLKLKPLFLLKHILPHRNSLTLCKKNDYKLPYVENPNTESQCPFHFAHHIFIRCRNKYKNLGIKRETPGCDTRQEPGFDSTPMFTAIRISF